MGTCHGFGGNQLFRLNTEGQLTSGEWCTDVNANKQITVNWCKAGFNGGPWEFQEKEQQLYHKRLKMCLALEPESMRPIVRPCDKNNSYHKWSWKTITPYWAKKG